MQKILTPFVAALLLLLTLAPQAVMADITSPTAVVNVFESRRNSSTIDTTKIVYQLVTTTDAAGNTYIPIDMGYGVAWADRNIGATSNTVKGDYYRWGSTVKQTTSVSYDAYYANIPNMSVGDELPIADDAAAQVMGKDAQNRVVWRIPSKDEYTALRTNCTETQSASTLGYLNYQSKNSSNYIRFYATGFIQSGSSASTSATIQARVYCWTRTLSWIYSTSSQYGYSGPSHLLAYGGSKSPSVYINNLTAKGSPPVGAAYQALNVRGIYNPPFTTHKLTIKAQLETNGSPSTKANIFVVEEGQTVRVTARPIAGHYFLKWSDNDTHQTRDFELDENLTVTAIYTATEPVQSYTIRFLNYNSDVLQSSVMESGQTPSYTGSMPTKPSDTNYKYSFSGWSPTIAAVSGDQDYVAQFSSSDLTYSIAVPNVEHGTITARVGAVDYAEGDVISDIARGTTVTFTAVPDAHYVLSGWTGELSGTELSTTLTTTLGMAENIEIGASFALEQFTISATAANPAMGSVTGGNTYSYGAAVTLTATANDGYRFVEWSDGNTSNPRNFTASKNLNLTATFGLESVDQTVKVYQGATADTTKILYALTAKTVGGTTYTPIDLGYGVAWADRNIGAANESAVGSLFYWGGTSATNTFRSGTYQTGIASVAAEADFSTDYDAAYQIIGHYWRVPSKSDWQALINEYGSVTTFTSKISNEGFSLPANGYIQSEVSSQSQLSSSEADYWSRTKGYKGSGSNDRAWVFKNGSMNSGVTGYASYGLPIRPIYQPTFTIYTLTINVGSYKYVYKCQSGQSITVNVHATELGASFDEWSEDHNTNATRTFTVTGNATYTATFAAAPTYAITFVDEDGETVLDGPNDVIEGNIPVYGGETPTKAATAQYTYAFDGWSPALYAADKAQTYTATYSSTVNQYTVTWKSENGESTLETDADQNYGTTTAFNGTTPTKAADAEYTYTFDGWATEANGDLAYANGSTPTVSGDATYFAHFNATEIVTAFDLEDDHGAGDDYYDDYAALVTAGNAIDITYKRSFKAGRWATFSLPFGYSFQNLSHNTFRDQVFELTSVDYADGRMVINCVKNSTGIAANTPYILIPTSDIVNPTFEGVTPKAIAAGSKTVNNTKDDVYTVEFISTAYKQVMPTGKRTIYISGNRLYYANVDTDIPAFRGYFNLKGGADVLHIQPRLVIAAPDGETIEQAEEAVAETRKYIENGILVIERNGVKYDAQGHVIK